MMNDEQRNVLEAATDTVINLTALQLDAGTKQLLENIADAKERGEDAVAKVEGLNDEIVLAEVQSLVLYDLLLRSNAAGERHGRSLLTVDGWRHIRIAVEESITSIDEEISLATAG